MIQKNINFIFRLLSLVCIVMAIFRFQARAQDYQQKTEVVKKENLRITKEASQKYKDGEYTGEGTGFGGKVVVQVIIKDGGIEKINIVNADKEDQAYLDQAIAVLDKMVETQDPEVDTISGATFSSKGLIEASKKALLKAQKD